MRYFFPSSQKYSAKTLLSTRAFTLVETMVAVAIITVAVAGPMVTASRAALAANLSRDQLTASYLAQEGVEYVRMLRDQTYLTNKFNGVPDLSATSWREFVTGSKDTSITNCRNTTCTFDPAEAVGFSLTPCTGNACGPLYVANGIYTQKSDIVGSTKTPFTRTITVIDRALSDERVVSTVSWVYHKQTYSITITGHLTPWQ